MFKQFLIDPLRIFWRFPTFLKVSVTTILAASIVPVRIAPPAIVVVVLVPEDSCLEFISEITFAGSSFEFATPETVERAEVVA